MAIGTFDILYTVRLKDGSIVEMKSGQFAVYKFFIRYITPVLWVLFFPIRKIYKLIKYIRNKIWELKARL
jgi:hypothetical protein